MLMVKGVLYMWIRNANENGEESQLAWSSDHGKTWKYCVWKFTEGFGCPTFLNFGKNYEGARDKFVYIYSFNEKDAYKPSDQMVIARVNKNRILNRDSYEFFKTMDEQGKPAGQKILLREGLYLNILPCVTGQASLIIRDLNVISGARSILKANTRKAPVSREDLAYMKHLNHGAHGVRCIIPKTGMLVREKHLHFRLSG